jgi:hypothetical protein
MLTYTIVLAHSIIPHHHHDDHKIEHSSPIHDEAENSFLKGEDGFAHQFGNYMHSVNTSDVYPQPESFNFSEVNFVLFIFKFCEFYKEEDDETKVSLAHDFFYRAIRYVFFKGLRAPPILS